MRSYIPLVNCLVLFTLLAVPALPADKPADGKVLYRANCKVCHDKGSPNGEYSPLTLIQDQWTEFFNTKFVNSHKDAKLPDGKKLLDTLNDDLIKSIKKFSIDHAADSEHPQTCS